MPGNINTIPLSVISSWPKPNYVDPVRRTWLPAFSATLLAVSSLMVLTRLWLRIRHQAGAFGLDDWFLLPAWLAAIAVTVFTILSPNYGSDRHTWDVPITLFEPLAEAAWASELLFFITTGCTKISCLLFYRRLIVGTYSRRWKMATIAAIWFTVLYVVVFCLLLIFNCTPLEAYWKSYNLNYNEEYHCIDTSLANPISGVLSVVSDFYSVLLPCLMLRHLDAPKRQKIALNIVFSLGLLVVAAGSVRTYYLTQIGHSYDITWLGFNVYVATQLEVQLALICAAAPALRVFFRTYLSNPIKRTLNSSRRGGATLPDPSISQTATVQPSYSPNQPDVHTSRDAKELSPISQRSLASQSLDLESYPSAHTPEDFTFLKSPTSTLNWPLPNPAKNYKLAPQVVRTLADFESYALNDLIQKRPPQSGSSMAQMTFLRAESEDDLGKGMGKSAWEERGA